MEEKIKFIQDYINQCDEVISSGNYSQAQQLEHTIIGIFSNEIDNIKSQLDMYGFNIDDDTDYIGDIKILKQKLINYQINLKNEAEKQKYDLEMAKLNQPNISAHAESNQTQNNTININVSLPDAIRQIEDITENELSSEDKETLKDYLYSLEGIKTTKNKSAFWGLLLILCKVQTRVKHGSCGERFCSLLFQYNRNKLENQALIRQPVSEKYLQLRVNNTPITPFPRPLLGDVHHRQI